VTLSCHAFDAKLGEQSSDDNGWRMPVSIAASAVTGFQTEPGG
jgi:hypothetical protein